MILMQKNGAFMHAYNPKEVERLKAKGWAVVEAPKKTRKKRVKK